MINSTIENGVLTLSIDRQEKKNALTGEMYLELANQITSAQTQDRVRCILIRGEGDNFCAGNDLKDFLGFAEGGGLAGGLSDFPPLALLHSLVDNRIPIVAAVQGAAIGIGLTMLLHCDLILCAEDVRLQTPFVDLGLVPEGGSSLLLPERVGKANAAEILLLGAPISAQRALQMGLCNRVCATKDLHNQSLEMSLALAAKPPEALAQSKAMLMGNTELMHEHIDEEAMQFIQRLQSEEAMQSLARFFKR